VPNFKRIYVKDSSNPPSTNVGRMVRPGPGYAVAIGDSLTAWNGDGSPLRQRHTWF
jgi:hypothetical protein